MCVEGVGAAVVIGLDSCDSPSALSVPRAHSIDRSALESPLRSPRLYVLYNLAVLVGQRSRSNIRTLTPPRRDDFVPTPGSKWC